MRYYKSYAPRSANGSFRMTETTRKIIKDNHLNVADIIEEAVLNYESKPSKIKRGLKDKKKELKEIMEKLEELEKITNEYRKIVNELNKEIDYYEDELEKNEIPVTPEYTENETLNNLIDKRIIQPAIKSRFSCAVDYLNANYYRIKKVANRFGLNVSLDELTRIISNIDYGGGAITMV